MICEKCAKPIQPLGYYENIEYCRCGQIVTPEKQERPYRIESEGVYYRVKGPNYLSLLIDNMPQARVECKAFNEAYAQGAASRDAEVEALKAEVARFSRDANYWKWCNGCGSTKEDCEKWKDAGKVACCPDCHHWPWWR